MHGYFTTGELGSPGRRSRPRRKTGAYHGTRVRPTRASGHRLCRTSGGSLCAASERKTRSLLTEKRARAGTLVLAAGVAGGGARADAGAMNMDAIF